MDDSAKGVILDMMQMGKYTVTASMGLSEFDDLKKFTDHVVVAQNLPCETAVIDELWNFDALEVGTQGLLSVMEHIFFDTRIGEATGRTWTSVETFRAFSMVVKDTYLDRPYHNFFHACDVTQTVYRLLIDTNWKQWMSDVEVYALLLSALCHDLGHPGVANPFLMETRDALAMTYNDQSPLENMHCAKMFQICSKEETSMFRRFDNDSYKKARKVCVSTILHTDASLHFDMVKQVTSCYELTSELCEIQANLYFTSRSSAPDGPMQLNSQFRQEVLMKEPLLWLKLFLHLADISNPMKPFSICKAWSRRVLDEFFAQGDKEKSLGLPVGMLNDREKVNMPGSQHGFIIFLVAPCLVSTVKVFRVLLPLAEQLASNLQAWADLWEEDAKPSQQEKEKRAADVQKVRDTVMSLDDASGQHAVRRTSVSDSVGVRSAFTISVD
jgi:cAMP-specific phosphodiesterase 4